MHFRLTTPIDLDSSVKLGRSKVIPSALGLLGLSCFLLLQFYLFHMYAESEDICGSGREAKGKRVKSFFTPLLQ